ncbi:MAG TPA: hypothetical protein VNB22_00365 [Pyrinomonadaceae bacterium]|jgi:hypothetical protein|nr:hypothetical protein [Pyrinomonadaceae bacterium]
MKPVTYLFLGVLLTFAGIFGYTVFTQTISAQKVARIQWEYAAITSAYAIGPNKDRVNRIYGMAEICYLQANGCRRAEVKHELDYGSYLQERAEQETFQSRNDASLKAAEIAFQKAVAQFGSEGWEIVGEPKLDFEFVNVDDYNKFENKSVLFERMNTKAVYFKRLKTQ